MENCLFCKIIRKEIPATILLENEHVIVFMDIKPVNPGHLLVVPKIHSADYVSTSDEALGEIAVVAKRMGQAVMSALGAPAFNVGVNNGRAAGQLVDHMHLHVMPRHEGDGHAMWRGAPYAEGEMAVVAEKILQQLKSV